MLSRLREQNSALRTSVRAAPKRVGHEDLALAIALFGPAFLASTDLAGVRQTLWPPSSSGSSCSALHGTGQCPSGFHADHLKTAADSLARKRARSVQKTWPATAAALGKKFGEIFRSYCAQHPTPPEYPFEDGCQFAQWLERKHMLPPQ